MPKQLIVPGHALRFEGRFWRDGRPCNDEGQGRCACGQVSPILPSTAARQRWHREHKQAVLAETNPPRAQNAGRAEWAADTAQEEG
jgi:hypothetical protein